MNNCSEAPFLFLLYTSQARIKSNPSQPGSNSNSTNSRYYQQYHQQHGSPNLRHEIPAHEDSMRRLRLLARKVDPPQAQRRRLRPLNAYARPRRPSPRSPPVLRQHPARKRNAGRHCQIHRLALVGQRLAIAHRELRYLPVLVPRQERPSDLPGRPRDHQAGEQVAPAPARCAEAEGQSGEM